MITWSCLSDDFVSALFTCCNRPLREIAIVRLTCQLNCSGGQPEMKFYEARILVEWMVRRNVMLNNR